MAKQRIYIASDHAGFALKARVQAHFQEFEWFDLGTESEDSVDYPDYADRIARRISTDGGIGILICGSGQGMAIRANRYPSVRAALCWSPEVAQLSRQHNDANVLCLPGRLVEESINLKTVEVFMRTAFEGGRHQRRVDKLGSPC